MARNNMFKRVIVKIGTGVVSKGNGELDEGILESLVDQIAALRKRGIEVVIITSGAVGAGRSVLSHEGTDTEVVRKQVFAAVGQARLMNIYSALFAKHGYLCAQVLATKGDFRDAEHYQNMKNCFKALILDAVVPIVNENDVVATAELMFTDNDELAGLIVTQLEADTLFILTSTDGILDGNKKTVLEVNALNAADVAKFITDDASAFGRGGMKTKFAIARELSEKGTTVYIVNGKTKDVLLDVADGAARGTRFITAK